MIFYHMNVACIHSSNALQRQPSLTSSHAAASHDCDDLSGLFFMLTAMGSLIYVDLHYKLLYWSESQADRVTGVKPAAGSSSRFHSASRRTCGRLQTLLRMCVQIYCVHVHRDSSSAVCRGKCVNTSERRNFHIASSVTLLFLPVTSKGARHYSLKF